MTDKKSSIEISLIKPYPDVRAEARIHALSNEKLNLFSDKADILDIVTNHKFRKTAYYDLYNSDIENNSTIIFNFRLVTSKVFKELIKSSTQALIKEKSELDAISEEFNNFSNYTRSCEYFVSIKMNELIQLLLGIKSHQVFNIYYSKFLAEIDKEISYQIKARNVFSDIINKCQRVNENYANKAVIKTALDEIAQVNNSKFIKLVIHTFNITANSTIEGTEEFDTHLMILQEDGIKKEITNLICNCSNLNKYQIELIVSYCSSNNITIESLVPCNFNYQNCKCKSRQIIKILDRKESPCPIFIENKDNKSNVVFDQITKNLNGNAENPYYKLQKKVNE